MTLAIYFNFYNPIGELAAKNGIDYANLIITELDKNLPTYPILIVPYVIAFFCPIGHFLYQFFHGTLNLGQYRRVVLVQMLMITIGSFIFYYFPVTIKEVNIKKKPEEGIFAIINFQVVHTGMSLFCSFPSMHVAHAWYQYFFMQQQKAPGTLFVGIIAWFQFPATVLLKAHILMDLPAGFLLSYICAAWILAPMEKAKVLEPSKNRPYSVVWAGVFSLFPICTLCTYQYLLQITEWGGLTKVFDGLF